MTDARRPLLALSLAAAAGMLAGCPIPQPLPGVGNTDAGVTPPRILFDSARPSATFIPFDSAAGACDGGPLFDVRATVVDQNPDDVVEGRWFVDYEAADLLFRSNPVDTFNYIPSLPNGTTHLATLSFAPASATLPVLPVQVVELVVSNGFDSTPPDGGLPNRTAKPGYETQIYRWVFQPVAGSGADGGCGP
jgi:hypothetical protein